MICYKRKDGDLSYDREGLFDLLKERYNDKLKLDDDQIEIIVKNVWQYRLVILAEFITKVMIETETNLPDESV